MVNWAITLGITLTYSLDKSVRCWSLCIKRSVDQFSKGLKLLIRYQLALCQKNSLNNPTRYRLILKANLDFSVDKSETLSKKSQERIVGSAKTGGEIT